MSTPKIFFGAGLFSKDQGFSSAEDIEPWFDALSEYKEIISGIDSAVAYRECETWLGQAQIGPKYGFPVDTKLTGGAHPTLVATKENVISQGRESLQKIGVKQISILFLHAPEFRVPLEETLAGIDTLYQEGLFKYFGIANHTAEQIEEVMRVCKEQNFVSPSFCQCSYSPLARLSEKQLLPVLRKYGISFVAYSPMAGGFLAKRSQQFHDAPESLQGRWSQAGFLGKVYHYLYNKPLPLEALDKWHDIAEAEGISSAELAYRWVAYNSALEPSDGLVIGASTIEQWKRNMEAIRKGPVSAEVAAKIDALWTPELAAMGTLDNVQAVKAIMTPPL
jgi:aflatoxin B1 aldehyde reductase